MSITYCLNPFDTDKEEKLRCGISDVLKNNQKSSILSVPDESSGMRIFEHAHKKAGVVIHVISH